MSVGGLRLVEVFDGREWVPRRLHEVKKGELFRLFEDDGTQFSDHGRNEFFAAADGFINARGTGSIEVDL